MTTTTKQSALNHLWMNDRSWSATAETGGPQIVTSGKGVHVTDSDGNEWMDVNAGYNSVNIGYGRPELADAMRDQMSRLIYFPQGATTQPLVEFVAKIAQITPGALTRSWPTTGGSEANETAIKIARAYHKRRGEAGRYKIISRRGSYHGALGATMWLGGRNGLQDYEPAFPGMLYAPQPDAWAPDAPDGETDSERAVRCAQAIDDLIRFNGASSVAAVIAEPVSASVGAAVPGDEYWPMLRQICDRHGVLLIADEVITGFGRTGEMFALDHWNVTPDIMTMAKGITSSYLPLANTIVAEEIADAFAGTDNIFRQALTFGGHPVTAAVALKNIEILESENMVQNSQQVGADLLKSLRDLAADHPIIDDVRGLGLLLAIRVTNPQTGAPSPSEASVPARLTQAFETQRLILRTASDRISIGPPLCLTPTEAATLTTALDQAFTQVEKSLSIK